MTDTPGPQANGPGEATPSFRATPVQEKLIDTITDGRYRIIGFGGGIRGTKTWGSLAAIILLCRIYPRSRWAVVRKDLPTLRRNTIPSFNKLRELAGDFVGDVNQTTWTSTCRNGSEIIFFSESLDIDPDLSRWKGLEVNGFLLEEADELAERSYHKAIERAGAWIIPGLGTNEQPAPIVLCTFNPCPNWPKRVFFEPWQHGSIDAPYAFIPATAADNPFVPDDVREAWKAMPPQEYRRFVEGDWTTLTGRYYEGLSPHVHLVSAEQLGLQQDQFGRLRLPDWWEYWSGYDWGYAHWAPYGAFCKMPEGTIVLLDTLWMRREQDEDMAQTIRHTVPERAHWKCLKEAYAGHDCWNKVVAHGASGVTTAEVFYRQGIWLAKADTDRVNGGRALRRSLSINKATGRPHFVMLDTPGNRRVYDQLAEIMPDENNVNKPGKADADSEGRGGDDGADMVRYGIATRAPLPAEPIEVWRAAPDQDPNRWQEMVGVPIAATRGQPAEREHFDQGWASQLPTHW